MPKLPKGMFKRRSSFYVRVHEGGKDRWKSLGPDYEVACRKLREIRLGGVLRSAAVRAFPPLGWWVPIGAHITICHQG